MGFKNLSLKYKVMLLLTVVPLLLLGSYLTLVVQIFREDKIAYIFDSNGSVNRSIAAQVRGVFAQVLSVAKPLLQEHYAYGEFGVLSQEVLKGESNLLFVGILNFDKTKVNLTDHIEKDKDTYNQFLNDLPNLNLLIGDLSSESRIVRTPYPNNNVLLLESFEDPLSKEKKYFALVFKSPELEDLFANPSGRNFSLNTSRGAMLFQHAQPSQKTQTPVQLNGSFFKKIRSREASEGSETLQIAGTTYLASYNKIGFGNLLVTSLVNHKKALSATQILMTKSLLFAGLLVCVTLLFSLLGSQSLTQALRDLLHATRRIAQGDFTSRVRVSTKDEVGSLAKSFNLMSEEVARLLNETAEKARMEGELQTARTVQETLFPSPQKQFERVSIAGHYEPASECGGDWWYYNRINNQILLCIGDATGHGAPAALITSAARSAASVLENLQLEPKQILKSLNKAIYDVSKGKVMMTFFLGIIDLDQGLFTFGNASHDPPFLVKKTIENPGKKDLIPLMEANNPRLGQDPNSTYDQHSLSLEEGDFFLFYTDGIAEIQNPEGATFGEREFIKLVVSSLKHRENPQQVVHSMVNGMSHYRAQANLIDDVTFFCVKYGGAA